MTDTIQFKRGYGNVPTLEDGEPAYNIDEHALYIGWDGQNRKLCDVGLEHRMKTYTDSIATIQNAKIEAMNNSVADLTARLDNMDELIQSITARLDALENSGE